MRPPWRKPAAPGRFGRAGCAISSPPIGSRARPTGDTSGESFTEAQRDVAFYAMRGLTWFHRQALLAHGLAAAGSPLSPMEHRVLALLLTDQSEKLIATNLRVTPSTAHTYVKAVFRKFGVSGRNGLMALGLVQ